ncbi:MAG: PilZ domain-containing protein [Vicinamibacterales bacterium]
MPAVSGQTAIPTFRLDERRSSPRVEVLSRVQGRNGEGDSVLLINVSEGGAMVHGNFAAQQGEVHEFRFTPEPGAPPLVFAARVVRVLQVAGTHELTFALGLEFVTTTEHQRQSIAELVAISQRLPH